MKIVILVFPKSNVIKLQELLAMGYRALEKSVQVVESLLRQIFRLWRAKTPATILLFL